ncbi:ATP-binding protein [Streptosporangium carneum]|nr:ATP-binding protein [Streptosporangium carneum]
MASGTDLVKVGILKLPRDDRAPGLVRGEMRRWLGTEHPALSGLVLAASELVTNAVRHADAGHGRNWVITALHEGGHFLRLAVTDPGSASSVPHRLSAGSVTEPSGGEGGRGLFIVNRLSGGRWGTYVVPGDGHRVVWCHLAPTAVEDEEPPAPLPAASPTTRPANMSSSPPSASPGAAPRLAVPEARRPR